MSIDEEIFKTLNEWVFNVETQEGNKLQVIDKIDLKEIITEIMEVVKKFNYIPCCKSDSEQLPNLTLEQAIAKAKPNMNISKEQFTKLAKEHLIALESYKMDKNGNKPIEIFGVEKMYEAINVIDFCKSDSDLLLCKHCDNKKALHSKTTGLCPNKFKHFEAK